MIIGITGKKQHGKNSVGDVLADHGFTLIGFADTLKDLSYAVDPIIGIGNSRTFFGQPTTPQLIHLAEAVDDIGWEAVKERYPEARRFLQRMGTEGAREHLGQNVWINAWTAKKTAFGEGAKIAACDVRFANEAAAIRAVDGLLWKVTRPARSADSTADAHKSETELESLEVSREFVNDGTLGDLQGQVELALCRALSPSAARRSLRIAS